MLVICLMFTEIEVKRDVKSSKESRPKGDKKVKPVSIYFYTSKLKICTFLIALVLSLYVQANNCIVFLILQQVSLNRVLPPNCIAIDVNNVKCILSKNCSPNRCMCFIVFLRGPQRIKFKGPIKVLSVPIVSCSTTIVIFYLKLQSLEVESKHVINVPSILTESCQAMTLHYLADTNYRILCCSLLLLNCYFSTVSSIQFGLEVPWRTHEL